MRLSARLVLQQVLEEGVTSWLGRGWNCRSDGERAGQRNGFSDVTVKTTAGPIEMGGAFGNRPWRSFVA